MQIVFTECGGQLLLRKEGLVHLSYRAHLTPGLVRRIAALALTTGARAAAIRDALVMQSSLSSPETGCPYLQPSVELIRETLERIFCGPTIAQLTEACKEVATHAWGEYSDLALDGSIKVAQATTGQRPLGQTGPTSDRQENVVITVLGRTGCLLCLEPQGGDGGHSMPRRADEGSAAGAQGGG